MSRNNWSAYWAVDRSMDRSGSWDVYNAVEAAAMGQK